MPRLEATSRKGLSVLSPACRIAVCVRYLASVELGERRISQGSGRRRSGEQSSVDNASPVTYLVGSISLLRESGEM